MALVPVEAGSFYSGAVTVTVSYDDGTLWVRRIRVVNNTANTITLQLTYQGNVITESFPPNSTTQRNIPNGVYQMVLDDEGNVNFGEPFYITPG